MTKRTAKLLRADRCRRWSAAIAAAALLGIGPGAMAQSLLRFVGQSDTTSSDSAPLPQPTVVPATPAQPSTSEFRFVDLSEGRVAPLPQLSVSSERVTTGGESTLKFATAAASQTPTVTPDVSAADAFEMRFKPLAPRTSQPAAPPAQAAAPDIACNRPLTARSVAPRASTQQFATELFASPPQMRASEFKPRIVMSVEHVPAPVPQHFDAQPVRSAREMGSVYAPVGTELFGSAEPTISTSAPREWDLPALDYGAALREIRPPQRPVVSAKPIQPTRVVARELPADAAGMFSLGPPETLVARSAVENLAATDKAAAIGTQPITPAPVVVEHQHAAAQQKPELASTPIPPVESKLTPAPTVAPPPIATAAIPERIVSTTPQLPAASELEFSQIPAAAEPPARTFAAAQPTCVSGLAPVSTPAAHERLVPASVASQPQAKPSFAYQPGPLASESHIAEYTPAVAAPPAVHVPERSQVVATVDPQDPNTYSFSYAASSSQPPAMYVNSMEPTAADGMDPQAMMPNALPVPCACSAGPYGQCGCPYLPGQSGTRALCGVDCGRCGAPCCSTWSDATCIPWALLGPGEYVGPARPAHVETYYLRVNDILTLTFIESRKKQAEHYRIGVGDQLQIEWLQGATANERALDRNLLVQPDGTVTLPLIGEVNAAGKTVTDFRDEVVKLYSKFQRDPQITVTPLTVNVAVQDVLKAVTSKNASSGQTQDVRVTPEGTIQAAGIGSVYVQGLTLDELRSELEARYAEAFGPGLAVSPQLTERATSYVFMGGEVRTPGRYVLEGPTTVMQAIGMAGGWNNGGNLRQVVVFRRDENWCLKATKIDVRAPLYGKDPCPTNDVWLRENDLVVVPKTCILCATDLIELYFTRGIYAVFPITYVYDFSQNSGLVPVP